MERETVLQRAWLGFFATAKGRQVAGTVTFLHNLDGIKLSENSAIAAIRLFAKKLDRRRFGNKAKPSRGGLRGIFAAVREGDCTEVGTHLNYHLLIGVPDRFSVPEWAKICDECWQEIRRAGYQNRFKEKRDPGWDKYMLKLYTKRNFDDCVDVPSLWLTK